MNIVGISAHFHDASCALLKGGELVAAASEEAFTRVKHDPRLPTSAFDFCLREAGLTIADIDAVAYYEDPDKKLERQLWMGLPECPPATVEAFGRLDPRRPKREIRELLGFDGHVYIVDHHRSHAASAYYFSGFDEAAILCVDAVGEWATTSYGVGRGAVIDLFEQVTFPHSIGMLYSTITNYLGFEVNEGEFKVMGLAPYGQARFQTEVRRLIRSSGVDSGQFQLELEYFDFLRGATMYSPRLCELFGQPPRQPESDIEPFHCDVARSLQMVLEDLLLEKARYLQVRTGLDRLCMAGGVALNCVANGRLLREGPFEDIFIQPAATDAGGALGAAALAHVALTGEWVPRPMKHVFLGPSFSARDISAALQGSVLKAADFRGNPSGLVAETARRLAAGQVVGWFQGRMEFGPRSLGARSILADPRDPEMRERVNSLVKKREGFRPFAPAVLACHASEHFDLAGPSPFMLLACQTKVPGLPAITHVDGSARVQTVDAEENERFHALLSEFHRLTDCIMVLNTSFNVRGEPIVCTPIDAVRTFLNSGLNALVLGDFLLDRRDLPPTLADEDFSRASVASGISHAAYTLF